MKEKADLLKEYILHIPNPFIPFRLSFEAIELSYIIRVPGKGTLYTC